MRQLMAKLWKDESGALISVEWVFVATILVIGVTSGLVAVRNAVNNELTEFASATSALCQDYCFDGTTVTSSCGRGRSCTIATTCGTCVRGDRATRYNFNGNDRPDVTTNPEDCPCN